MTQVLEVLSTKLQELGHDVHFEQKFACELNKAKREFIKHVVEKDTHIFTDVGDMGARTEGAPCCAHEAQCPLEAVNLLIAGLSCKDLSRAKASRPNPGQVFVSSAVGSSSSARTYFGWLEYLTNRPADLLIVENSDQLLEGNQADAQIFINALRERGYQTHLLLVDSHTFGLPQHRRRAYILGWLQASPLMSEV